ncbi:MAG: hypothetical protein HYU33_03880 [Candidatus Omnitrophica bacterium]|nr:hypothetical protein [Candidatus Omnitrophota bacterium]MBI3010630.1 hypothetical protein [Candidatus Omnitrophota bacterium]
MREFDVRAMTYAVAALCAGSVLAIGLANLASPSYGEEVLDLLASLYPGYHAEHTIESVLVATGYALVKGAVLGALFAWCYNRLAFRNR